MPKDETRGKRRSAKRVKRAENGVVPKDEKPRKERYGDESDLLG